MKRAIQTFIASSLAVFFVVIPVFSEPLPPPKPTEAGGPFIGFKVPEQIKPIAQVSAAPLQELQPIPVAPTPVATPEPATSAVAGCGDNSYANYIYTHESGCRTHNPNGSGCDGIGQACPASKVIGPCGYDYACQNAWFTDYANRTYGGWAGAYNFWVTHKWW